MREIPAKQLNGTDLTGSMLVSLACMYVEAVNTDGVPSINSAWASITANECDEAVNMSYKAYQEAVKAALGGWVPGGARAGLPMDDAPLRKLNDQLTRDAVGAFEARAMGDEQAEFKVKLWAKVR